MVVLSAPLISGILSALVPLRYSWLVSLTASFMLLLAVAGAVVLASTAGLEKPQHFRRPWCGRGGSTGSGGRLIGNYRVVMVLVGTVVSFFVRMYSAGYMAGDAAIRR